MSRALANLLAAYLRLRPETRARFRAAADAAEAQLVADGAEAPVITAAPRPSSTDRVRAWRKAQREKAAAARAETASATPDETRETVDETRSETHDETVSSDAPLARAPSSSADPDLPEISPSFSADQDLKTGEKRETRADETCVTRDETQSETQRETRFTERPALTLVAPSKKPKRERPKTHAEEVFERVYFTALEARQLGKPDVGAAARRVLGKYIRDTAAIRQMPVEAFAAFWLGNAFKTQRFVDAGAPVSYLVRNPNEYLIDPAARAPSVPRSNSSARPAGSFDHVPETKSLSGEKAQ